MPGGRVDERTFAAVKMLRKEHPDCRGSILPIFKARVREQTAILRADAEAAIAALLCLVPDEARSGFVLMLRRVAEAAGPLSPASLERLDRIVRLLPQQNTSPATLPPELVALPRRAPSRKRPRAETSAREGST